jgi:hypothetical protein
MEGQESDKLRIESVLLKVEPIAMILQPGFMFDPVGVSFFYPLPEAGSVIHFLEMGELMNDNVIHDAFRRQ